MGHCGCGTSRRVTQLHLFLIFVSTMSYSTGSLPLTDIDINTQAGRLNDCDYKKMAEELTELRYGTHSVILFSMMIQYLIQEEVLRSSNSTDRSL